MYELCDRCNNEPAQMCLECVEAIVEKRIKVAQNSTSTNKAMKPCHKHCFGIRCPFKLMHTCTEKPCLIMAQRQ